MPRPTPRRLPLDLGALTGVSALLRLSGARTRDPEVDAWLAEGSELRALARHWFARMRACGDDVRELLHDGCPVACVADAPFAYVNAFRNHVNVGFFQGAALADPARLLEGSGKRMRHVKLRLGAALDAEALQALIDTAYRDITARLAEE